LITSIINPEFSRCEEVFKKSFPFEAMRAATLYNGDNNAEWPPTLEALVPKYLKSIPKDGVTGSRKVVLAYDGTGGWVYNKLNGDVKINAPVTQSNKPIYKTETFYGKWIVKKINKVAKSTLIDEIARKDFVLEAITFKEKECEFRGDKIKNPKYVIRAENVAKRDSRFEPPHFDSYQYGYHQEREEVFFLDVFDTVDKENAFGTIEIIDRNELSYYTDGYLLTFERTQN
jgi:hypothetical protein